MVSVQQRRSHLMNASVYIYVHARRGQKALQEAVVGLAQWYHSGGAASATKLFTRSCEVGDGSSAVCTKCCMHEVLYTPTAVCTRCCIYTKCRMPQKAVPSSQPEHTRQKCWRNGFDVVPLLEIRDWDALKWMSWLPHLTRSATES